MPYLEDHAGALSRHPKLAYRVYVYSDVGFSLGEKKPTDAGVRGGGDDGWSSAMHWGPPQRLLPPFEQTAFCNCTCDIIKRECPMHKVHVRLQKIQNQLERHMTYLNMLQP